MAEIQLLFSAFLPPDNEFVEASPALQPGVEFGKSASFGSFSCSLKTQPGNLNGSPSLIKQRLAGTFWPLLHVPFAVRTGLFP